MKFGIAEVIHPYSTEKIMAEKRLYMFGEVKNKVQKVSNSIKGDKAIATAEAIKAIADADAGGTEYVAIEIFTDKDGVCHTNVCRMWQT